MPSSRTSASRSPGAGVLAVTAGEPAGIGADITVSAWSRRIELGLPCFVAYGSADVLKERARQLGLGVGVRCVKSPGEGAAVFGSELPVIDMPQAVPTVAGRPDPVNGPSVIAAIEAATKDVAEGRASALVTNPIAKSVLYQAGFRHPGHTEFLAELAGLHFPGQVWSSVMMLASDQLRVVPLTIHVALRTVPGAITRELLVATVQIVERALRVDFGIARPRIAVAGLNPHAGEDGSMGTEDRDIIAPAVSELSASGIAITGPLPGDTMFHAAARANYDAAICMYHDQALIPLKTLAFDEGVNVTLGLPFVRTSPDHGTAFDIAGTGRARAESFIEALRLAERMVLARAAYAAGHSSRALP